MRKTVMKKILFGAGAFAAVLLSSCGTTGKYVDISGEWNVVSVEGQEVTGNPYIGFDTAKGSLYGNVGCNRIMGEMTVDSVKLGKIGFAGIASTRMTCPDMLTEQKVLEALNTVAGYRASSAGVELTDRNGKVLLSLEKRETPVMPVEQINGRWDISKVDGAAVPVVNRTPFLSFNVTEKTVNGNGGCNIIGGSFSQEEDNPYSFKFGQMMTTMMAGPGLETERKILAAIRKVVSFAINEDGTLSLMDADDNEVLLLVKTDGETSPE